MTEQEFYIALAQRAKDIPLQPESGRYSELREMATACECYALLSHYYRTITRIKIYETESETTLRYLQNTIIGLNYHYKTHELKNDAFVPYMQFIAAAARCKVLDKDDIYNSLLWVYDQSSNW